MRCFVGEPGLFAKVPMVVGLNFSGAIEQVRIWQPVNPRIKVAACENLRQEYEATAVVANSGKAVVKSCREEVEKTRQVALLENVNLRCSKSLSCCVGFKNQQAEPISKTNKAATVAEVKCKSDQHKCQTALPQNSNYVALVDSGLLSDMCNLTEANNASENREGVLELGAKCYNKQLFQNQSCNSIGSRDAQSFMGAQSEEANGLSRALKGWDFKAVNYDNTHLGDFQLKSLLGNETYNGWENAVNKTDELKIGFGIFSCLLTEVKRNELWDETARTLENQFLVYIDNYVLEASDDYHAQKARTSKRSESEKLTFLKNSTNSELANVLKDDFKKCLELKSGASKLLITSPDAVNYVRCENQVLKLYSLLKHENLKWEQGSNLHSEVQNSLFQNGTIASGKRIRNGSVWLIRYYHNESDLLSLHTSDLRMGHKFSNYHLWQNHVTTDNICLATSFLVDDEGDRWIRDSSGPELEDGRFFQMDGAPCDSRRSFEVQGWEEEEWTWGIKAYAYICDPHLSSNMINRSHWQTAGLVDHYNEPDRSDGHMLHRSYVIKSIFGYGYEIEPSPPPV